MQTRNHQDDNKGEEEKSRERWKVGRHLLSESKVGSWRWVRPVDGIRLDEVNLTAEAHL